MKRYEELSPEQKEQVSKMYTDSDHFKEYVYNFDDNGVFHGRSPLSELKEEDTPLEVAVEKVKEVFAPKTKKSKKNK